MARNGIYCPLEFKLIKNERINLGTNSYVFNGIIVASAVYYFDNVF